jgi:predicted aconitase
MKLAPDEQAMINGDYGPSTAKAMEILVALGKIYDAEKMVPVSSVQIAGVSYDNLGNDGLMFLSEMAEGGGQVRVLTTLNPAGMDVENWQALGISSGFAEKQIEVIEAFSRMGVIPTCSCTPYLFGNLPIYGEHIAWAESSAVCFANSVLGARTNREGGPSALAAALTGLTPAYGYHLPQNRLPSLTIEVSAQPTGTHEFGALGMLLGRALEQAGTRPVPYICGISRASLEELKSFCASLATYGGAALFHLEGLTPEASQYDPAPPIMLLTQSDLERAAASLDETGSEVVDFVSLGCPHLSINEIARLAALLEGQHVRKEFWVTTSRPIKQIADRMGYTKTIEDAGAVFAVDTCCVVAPIKGRFQVLATDSAKACYYAHAKNGFKTRFLPFDEVVREALR